MHEVQWSCVGGSWLLPVVTSLVYAVVFLGTLGAERRTWPFCAATPLLSSTRTCIYLAGKLSCYDGRWGISAGRLGWFAAGSGKKRPGCRIKPGGQAKR